MNLKKIIAGVTAACVMGTFLPYVGVKTADNAAVTASAYTEGTYEQLTYEKFIGSIVISDCDESATSVVIPAEIDGLPVISIGSRAFLNCESLTEIVIPDSIKNFGIETFYGCKSLTEINIPNGVTSIGNNTFGGCTSLTKITIPDSVTNFAQNVFKDTPWLKAKQAEDPIVVVNGILIDGTTCSGDVVIPDSVTSIGDSAFRDCTAMTGIIIPNSVTSICNGAFSGCTSLTEIIIPDSVTSISGNVFYNTPWLKAKRADDPLVIVNGMLIDGKTCSGNVVIPDSVTSIGWSAFFGCTGLTGITVSDNVKNVDDFAFYDCTGLTKITFKNPICKIDDSEYTISDTATIYGYENSTAHEYANKYNRKMVTLDSARPQLNYTITESEPDKSNIAKRKSVEAKIDYSTIDNTTSCYTWGVVDRLQECKDSKGNIFAIVGEENSITLFSENTDRKPVKIENDGFTFGAATIDENDNLYVLWGYSISEDIIEEEKEKNTENLVIMKYDLNGKILGRCGIPITTSSAQYPFDAGNASMAVKDNVVGCFFNTEWTKSYSGDGLNHQGSEFAAINKDTMKLLKFSDWEGSHSFGVSLIPTDYGFAGLQKGDCYPRGINFNSYLVSDNKVESDYIARNGEKIFISASGTYGTDGNATYLHMGGLAKSATTYAIVGKSERVYSSMEYYGDSDLRTNNYDVFLKITDQTLFDTASDLAGVERVDVETGETADYNIIWLTECNETEKAGQTKVVTLADGSYCVLWEKFGNGKFDSIRYVVTDECGNILRHETAIYGARLSDTSVQPIVEGYTLKWAVADKENQCVNFYTVDLNEFSETSTNDMLGDVNGDSMVDSSDASLVLVEYAMLSTGKNGNFSESVKKLADLNKDGMTDSSDASLILAYYAHVSTGGTDSIEDFLNKNN
ncbi:MAG: leucine-rich repeat protein [Ruminococcus sp.]|nr:leucine-rich repeat protein [Ruminococcus sp.]